MENKMGTGLRYNDNKNRLELVSNYAINEMAKVYTYGAKKYTLYNEDGTIKADGANNWRNGMKWSTVLASLKRHIAAFERGEDFDPESLEYHLSHAMTNCSFLLEYYKIYPQGDDRRHKYLNMPRIGLDIDDVIADFVKHWIDVYNCPMPESWNFDRNANEKFEALKKDKDFWMSIPVKTKPSDLGFEPHCYITSRSIPQAWTEEWLDKNGFPTVPVYTVPYNTTKVEVAKKCGIDIFVDDKFQNFVELNNAGICCYLFNAKHNEKYDVGYKRIHNLKDLVTW